MWYDVCPTRIFKRAKHAASFQIKYMIQKNCNELHWAQNTPLSSKNLTTVVQCITLYGELCFALRYPQKSSSRSFFLENIESETDD